MNKKIIKRIWVLATFLLVLTSSACYKNPDKLPETEISVDSNQGEQPDDLQGEDDQLYDIEDSTKKEYTISKDAVEPAATKEMAIYTINETNQEVESVIALVPKDSEITPELIVDLVEESLADRLITVGIETVTTQEDTVIVSFFLDKPPIANVGSGVETTILDAIAQSLVDNLTEYPKVIFRVEGKAYVSGHYQFGLNEVYLDGNKTK